MPRDNYAQNLLNFGWLPRYRLISCQNARGVRWWLIQQKSVGPCLVLSSLSWLPASDGYACGWCSLCRSSSLSSLTFGILARQCGYPQRNAVGLPMRGHKKDGFWLQSKCRLMYLVIARCAGYWWLGEAHQSILDHFFFRPIELCRTRKVYSFLLIERTLEATNDSRVQLMCILLF